MKPIKLVIQGLNSFKEAQEIDFEALTSYGLFGVFGPTGSGKSTILDGMTLALYGKTSRESTNFINVQSDRAQIAFDFSVNGMHYRVVRTYKRQKNGSILATKPTRIECIDIEHQQVLEEKTTAVNQKCFEIIGLEFKDFIRTVVLPQGKFSEFIQLKGKDRREMLERLFDLSKYGDELSIKLSSAKRQMTDQELEISGELKGFESVSTEEKERLNDQFNTMTLEVARIEKMVLKEQASFNDLTKKYELTQRFDETRQLLDEMDKETELILEEEKMCKETERVLRVKPYYDQYNGLLSEGQVLVKKVHTQKEELASLKVALSKEEEAFVLLDHSFQNFSKHFLASKQKLKDQLEHFYEYKKTLEEKQNVEEAYKRDAVEKKVFEDKNVMNQEKIKLLNETIEISKKEVEKVFVTPETQKHVDEGAQIEEQLLTANNQLMRIQKQIDENPLKEKQALFLEHQNMLNSLKAALEAFDLTEETYLSTRTSLQERIQTEERLCREKREKEEALEQGKLLLNDYQLKKDELQVAYDLYLDQKEQHWIGILQTRLSEGEACPVCGSLNHQHQKRTTVDWIENDIEKRYQNNLIELRKQEQWLSSLTEAISSIALDFDDQNRENLNRLEEKYQDYLQAKSKYDTAVLECEHLNSLLELLEHQMKDLTNELIRMNNLIEELQLKRQSIQQVYPCDDYSREKKQIYEHLLEHQKRLEVLEKHHDDLRISKEQEQKFIRLIEQLGTDIQLKEQTIHSHCVYLEKILTKIELDVDYEKALSDLLFEHERLSNEHKKSNETLNKKRQAHEEMVVEYQSLVALSARNEKAQQEVLKQLEARLKEEELTTELLERSHWSRSELEDKQKKIEAFYLKKHQLDNRLKELNNQLKEQRVSLETLNSQKTRYEAVVLSLDSLKKETTVVEKELCDMNIQLKNLKALMTKKEAIEYKLSLLKDLDSLFKGKKFVEFVAAYHLRYISVEASERLFDITSGKYGLEVDDNGQFLIRDYGHGGEQRDTSTLSGGESFLVSLSLALSLSSQIQLKGRAPLELFFLDEGFGTLDDRFLELVMTSLERIHHNRLSIGLISHVDAIKNRVPIKLQVSPSVAGVKGSHIRIEKT